MKKESISHAMPKLGPGFEGIDLPREEDLYSCVHCGLCLSSCPTYMELDLETESPRGRIAFMKAVSEGRLGISGRVVSHWELCLQCRACEAVCPSGVPFGRLMENTRAQVRQHGKESWRLRLVKALFLRGALPHPWRLKLGVRLLRVYQRWGFRGMLRLSRLMSLLPGQLAELEAGLPRVPGRFFEPTQDIYRAELRRTGMVVGLLSGCVMPLVQGPTMEATVRVLNRNGVDVAVPMGQGCCGALNLHGGDMEMARRMARRNIDVFLKAGVEKIVVASAGCGSTMKEHHDLLRDDLQYREKAEQFSTMTVDVTQFLVELPFDPPKGEVPARVTYQDPCHLAHAQRITRPPRVILGSIPGLDFVEMESASMCCGAAGTYSITQPEMSRRLRRRKVTSITATGADRVATANPGCTIQLETGLRRTSPGVQVCHVIELLDESYGKES